MTRFVPWLLVALCFVLGVASRSISDTFPVFVPALEHDFGASRSAVTIIYSFALLVGGISGPVNGWILDRFGLRVLTVTGMTPGGARDLGGLARHGAMASLCHARRHAGLRRRGRLGRAQRLAARPLVPDAAARRGARRRLVGLGRRHHAA